MGKAEPRKKPCKRGEDCCMFSPCQRSALKKAKKKAKSILSDAHESESRKSADILAYPVKDAPSDEPRGGKKKKKKEKSKDKVKKKKSKKKD